MNKFAKPISFTILSCFILCSSCSGGHSESSTNSPSLIPPMANEVPSFTSEQIHEVQANLLLTGYNATAEDRDGDILTFSISGGTDGALFNIDRTSGRLDFKTRPDYSNPSDDNADGVYEVTIRVSDGRDSADQTLNLTIIEPLSDFLVNTGWAGFENDQLQNVSFIDDVSNSGTANIVVREYIPSVGWVSRILETSSLEDIQYGVSELPATELVGGVIWSPIDEDGNAISLSQIKRIKSSTEDFIAMSGVASIPAGELREILPDYAPRNFYKIVGDPSDFVDGAILDSNNLQIEFEDFLDDIDDLFFDLIYADIVGTEKTDTVSFRGHSSSFSSGSSLVVKDGASGAEVELSYNGRPFAGRVAHFISEINDVDGDGKSELLFQQYIDRQKAFVVVMSKDFQAGNSLDDLKTRTIIYSSVDNNDWSMAFADIDGNGIVDMQVASLDSIERLPSGERKQTYKTTMISGQQLIDMPANTTLDVSKVISPKSTYSTVYSSGAAIEGKSLMGGQGLDLFFRVEQEQYCPLDLFIARGDLIDSHTPFSNLSFSPPLGVRINLDHLEELRRGSNCQQMWLNPIKDVNGDGYYDLFLSNVPNDKVPNLIVSGARIAEAYHLNDGVLNIALPN